MIVNAMSIDVEDYFHVSVFDGIVPRSQWGTMESRVVRNTERLLDLVENFIAFQEERGGLVKKVAMNHQFLGVNRAIEVEADRIAAVPRGSRPLEVND